MRWFWKAELTEQQNKQTKTRYLHLITSIPLWPEAQIRGEWTGTGVGGTAGGCQTQSGITQKVLIASVWGNLAFKAIFLQSPHPFNKAHVRIQEKGLPRGAEGTQPPPSTQGAVLLEPAQLPWCNAGTSSAPAPVLVGEGGEGAPEVQCWCFLPCRPPTPPLSSW